ncbi:hypothetical protein DYI25_02225 [Mesobacillus boroniphilus]|uniref:DUF4129 domain-containing protein n=1 Tax=Mesobacillus boroniphilus TaxID=308892 RepID=A0A944CJ85_9BACI|nr:hypothetical protein [Mesobacillus boroniphilus]MBS8263251.1 hypothetical protein [Mesobacillus boroniphilus]
MKNRVLNVFFRFYIEWTFASLILVIFHLLSSQVMPLLAAMGIAAAASMLFTVLLELKPHLAKPLYFLVIMPLLFVAGNLSNLEIFYLGIMAILIFSRVLKFHQDSTSHSESVWLVVTFLIGVFVSPLAYFYGESYLIQIVFLLIFQLLFVLSGQFLLKWMDIKLGSKKRFVVTYSKLLGFILLLVAVLTFGRDLLKQIFFIVLQVIGWMLSLLLYPFFAWIASPAMQARANKVFSGQLPNMENDIPFEQSRQVFDPDFWGPILFVIIIGLAFYLIYKKTNLFSRQTKEEAVQAGFFTTTSIDGPANSGHLTRRRTVVPSNLIRKEIFQLEKYAYKKELGRLNHEDVKEWFERLGIHYEPRTIQTYERVRYGEHLDENIDSWFKDEIKTIKKQFNALEKLRKEESKTGLKDNIKNIFRR